MVHDLSRVEIKSGLSNLSKKQVTSGTYDRKIYRELDHKKRLR